MKLFALHISYSTKKWFIHSFPYLFARIRQGKNMRIRIRIRIRNPEILWTNWTLRKNLLYCLMGKKWAILLIAERLPWLQFKLNRTAYLLSGCSRAECSVRRRTWCGTRSRSSCTQCPARECFRSPGKSWCQDKSFNPAKQYLEESAVSKQIVKHGRTDKLIRRGRITPKNNGRLSFSIWVRLPSNLK